jgi:hypothetical protein
MTASTTSSAVAMTRIAPAVGCVRNTNVRTAAPTAAIRSPRTCSRTHVVPGPVTDGPPQIRHDDVES